MKKAHSHYEGLLANQIEKEQIKIAHESHDTLGSQLASISLQTAGIKLLSKAGKYLDEALEQLQSHIKIAAEITRDLARGLAPVDDFPGAFAQ